jgi:hypothetical protein
MAKSHPPKITDAQVEELRRLYAAGGISQEALARQFGLSLNHTHSLIKNPSRRKFKHP